MTQSTLRFLIGGLIATGLLATLARGDDMNISGFRGVASATEGTKKQLKVGDTFLACAVDLEQSWSTRIQHVNLVKIMHVDLGEADYSFGCVKREAFVQSSNRENPKDVEAARNKQVADLLKQYHEFYKAHKYQLAELAAIKAQELDPDNYVIAAAVQSFHSGGIRKELQDLKHDTSNRVTSSFVEIPGQTLPLDSQTNYQQLKPLANDVYPRVSIGGIELPLIISTDHRENEREVNRRLDGPMTAFDYHETPLQQILDDLASWSQVNIVPDASACKAAHISLEMPISMCMEGASLKTALNFALQKGHLKYEVENDALVIMPVGFVRTGLDCFTDPKHKANPDEPLDLSSNGLKRLGVDLASTSSDRPHLPPSAAAFVATKTVDCPIDLIHISHGLYGFGGVHLQFNPAPQEPSLLSAFLPQSHYLDQAVPANFTFWSEVQEWKQTWTDSRTTSN